jgi:hypothetical protein
VDSLECSDLLLKIDERLLVHLEESVPRSVKIDHEGNDRTKDNDHHDGGKRTASPGQARVVNPTHSVIIEPR